MSSFLKRSLAGKVIAVLVVAAGTACGGEDLVSVDHPVLLTAAPPGDDEITFDSAWGGTLDSRQECVTVVTGEYRSVLVAPNGSLVMEDPDTGELFLRVNEEDYSFDGEYKGGGVSVESAGGDFRNIPGADECIDSTDATDFVIVFTIESA